MKKTFFLKKDSEVICSLCADSREEAITEFNWRNRFIKFDIKGKSECGKYKIEEEKFIPIKIFICAFIGALFGFMLYFAF